MGTEAGTLFENLDAFDEIQEEAVSACGQDSPLGQLPALEPDMPFNPFLAKDQHIHGLYELLKTILLLPICVARLMVILLCILFAYLFSKVALVGAKDWVQNPLPKWRRKMLWPIRWVARLILFSCGFHWIKIKGRSFPREQAPVLVCNHVTFVEPLLIFFKHLPVIVTAQENVDMPVVGAVMRAIQVIAVKRDGPDSRRVAAAEIKRRAMCNDWNPVLIFPEGTTTNGKVIISFKNGAFKPGLTVQPIVVKYPYVHLDPSWVAHGISIYYLLFRLTTQFHNCLEVEYLSVVAPTWKEQKSPRDFAKRVQTNMAQALNVMVSEHSFEDGALLMEALKWKDFSGGASVEFGWFELVYKLKLREAKHYLRKFHCLDVENKGNVTFDEFLNSLELPNCPPLEQTFFLFDRTRRGYINFRQYLATLAFISRHKNFRGMLEAIFILLDKDKDGLLSEEETVQSLRDVIPSVTAEQAEKLWEKVNKQKDHFINKMEMFSFLQSNPEYVAVLVVAKPDLVWNSRTRIEETWGT
ncbi:hypothetical protein O6H91_17G004200 [Diphasiastrum complanatum]|nr:hypothetical protein O6H91_17G004200 [Diphasiastrum complanatum]